MAERINLPEAVVNEFASRNPSNEDLNQVFKLLKALPRESKVGTPIPFDLSEFQNTFVVWTPNKQWRIVFRRPSSDRVDIMHIGPEDS